MITAKLNAKDFIQDFNKKAEKFPAATNAAINDIASQTKTHISKLIRAEYNIKAADLNKNFKLKRSTWKTLRAEITGTGKGISISKFGAKRSSKPVMTESGVKRFVVKAKIKKAGPAKIIPGAFLGQRAGRGPGKVILQRTGEERHPLKKVYSIGVANMFSDEKKKSADDFIRIKFPAILEKNINYMGK